MLSSINSNYNNDRSDICFKKNTKIKITQNKKCVLNCSNDYNYKYEYDNICYEVGPNGTYNSSDNICIERKNINSDIEEYNLYTIYGYFENIN